jgi:hypothetical protein
VDVCNFYHGELGGFGLFNEYGVPAKNFFGMRAFQELMQHPVRAETHGGVPGKFAVAAGLNPQRSQAALLLANFNLPAREFRIQASACPGSDYEVFILDEQRSWERLQGGKVEPGQPLILELKAPAVGLVKFRKEP